MAPHSNKTNETNGKGQVFENAAFVKEDDDTTEEKMKHDVEDTSSQSNTTDSFDGQEKKKKKGKKKKDEKKVDGPPPVPFFQLFRFASATEVFLILISTLAAAGTGVCMPLMIVLFGDLTNTFVYEGLDPDTANELRCNLSELNLTISDVYNFTDVFNGTNFSDQIANFAIGTSVLGSVFLTLGFIFVTCLNLAAENQVYRIRNLFLKAILRQDIAWYDTKSSNDFASRITEDLNKIQDGIGEKIGLFVFCVAGFLSSIINAFIHGWELTLVMMAAMPVLTIAMGILTKIQASLTENELKAYAKAGGVAEEVLSSIRTVIAFGGQNKEINRFQDNLTFARQAGIKRGLVTGIGAGLVWGIIYASYALAFWYGITLILDSCTNNSYNPASLIVVFFSVLMGAMNIGQASPYAEAFSIARGAAATIYSIIDRVPPIDSSSPSGYQPDRIKGDISFEKVSFNYPSRPEVNILRGLTFNVSPGQTVALVGASGCGKSTCVQLIQRFYDTLDGAVKIDGIDVKELNLGWLRDQLGVVGQEPVLFGTTIGENIKYGREGVSQDEVEEAARQANAHEFIMRLPKKYDTLVGERGTQLSGGQKQRIAIARALLRNPKILLLDEATSALDTQSEAVVQKALDKARQGRTTIIVAHRLTTIRNADRIVVLKDGVVQEEGTHTKLMAKEGLYYQLVVSQGGTEDKEEFQTDEDDTNDINEQGQKWKQQEDELSIAESFSQAMPGFVRSPSLRSSQRQTYSPQQENSEIGSDDEANVKDVSIFKILQLNEKEWPYITAGVLGSAVLGLSTPFYAILFGEVLGALGEWKKDEARSNGDFYSLLFLAIGIITGISAFLQSFMFSIAGEHLTSRIRVLTFRAMLKQEIGWFDKEDNSVGSLCARLSGDASSVHGATGSRIGIVFQSISTLCVSISLAMYYQWKLGLVTAIFIPLLLISTYVQGKIIMGQNALERKSVQQSAKVAVEAISNIRTVASLRKEAKFHSIYMEALAKPHVEAQKKSLIRGIVFGFASSIPMFAYSVCMYYGGYLVDNENLPFENVFKVSESLIFGTQMIGQAVAFAPNYNKAKVAANRIFQLLNRQPYPPLQHGEQMMTSKGRVDFEKVSFKYPTRPNVPVLKGLNMVVREGQTVALVGHSGCGKSTCIQLLERFYEPEDGQIAVDSQDIASVDVSSLRSHLGIVSQEPVLFNCTIAENIAYGDNSRTVPMDEIIRAATQANIHSFVQSLPLGYETMVGERGTQLSGGQKQRVAIARALVRNPKILLLDEATSALDSESERVVQEALDHARQGRTCITIAHRLSTIKDADNIIVIHQGKIQEQGTHAELLELKGLYFELCSVQGLATKPSSSSLNDMVSL